MHTQNSHRPRPGAGRRRGVGLVMRGCACPPPPASSWWAWRWAQRLGPDPALADAIETLADLGVLMLLFIIGMEMRLQAFRKSLPLALGVTARHHR